MNNIIYSPLRHWLGDVSYNAASVASFAVDIEETDKHYQLHADLPGITKENISVQVADGVLSVNAKYQRQSDNAVRCERRQGEFARAFHLPKNVDATAIDAAMKDGVLTLTLPKNKDAATRDIEIN